MVFSPGIEVVPRRLKNIFSSEASDVGERSGHSCVVLVGGTGGGT